MKELIVSLPHLANYYIAAKPIMALFGDQIIVPPRITRRTLELGSKYSPESACIPFKYTLGNFIEALDKGANVLIQIGGGCRMGFYGEVQKVILEKLGYEFVFFKLINDHNIFKVAQNIHRIRPHLSYWTIAKAIYLGFKKAQVIDEIEFHMRLNIGFEVEKGSHERLLKAFLSALDHANHLKTVESVRQKYLVAFDKLPINKPARPLRVGVVGEIYVVMEPFSNFFIEKEVAQYGIEVHRFLTVSEAITHNVNIYNHLQKRIEKTKPYAYYYLAAHATESVATAIELAEQGFDGLIHVKPFGCMPEINAMPALHRISQDHNFPILYFSFDTLTSETGIKTRLEAFYDMLSMREVSHARNL